VEVNETVVIRDNILEVDSSDLLHSKMELMEKALNEGKWMEFIKPRTIDQPGRFPRNKVSENVVMNAGDFVKIKIKMFHSVHNALIEDGTS